MLYLYCQWIKSHIGLTVLTTNACVCVWRTIGCRFGLLFASFGIFEKTKKNLSIGTELHWPDGELCGFRDCQWTLNGFRWRFLILNAFCGCEHDIYSAVCLFECPCVCKRLVDWTRILWWRKVNRHSYKLPIDCDKCIVLHILRNNWWQDTHSKCVRCSAVG